MKNVKKLFSPTKFVFLLALAFPKEIFFIIERRKNSEQKQFSKPTTQEQLIVGEPIEQILSNLATISYTGNIKKNLLQKSSTEFFNLLTKNNLEAQIKYLSYFHNKIIKSLPKINGKTGISLCSNILTFWTMTSEKKVDNESLHQNLQNEIYKNFIDFSSENIDLLLKPDVENLVEYLKNMSTAAAVNLNLLLEKEQEKLSMKDIAKILLDISETIICKIEWKENQTDGVFSDMLNLFSTVKNFANKNLIEWNQDLVSFYFSISSRFKIFLKNSNLPRTYFENWFILLENGELNFAEEISNEIKNILLHWLHKNESLQTNKKIKKYKTNKKVILKSY